MIFGDYIKSRRIELGVSLRAFCAQNGEDPSNWSKLERGLLSPPEQYERLLEMGQFLGYSQNSNEMATLFELASLSRGEIPRDILSDPVLMEKLPLVFRTLREAPSETELLRLADLVRRTHSPDA